MYKVIEKQERDYITAKPVSYFVLEHNGEEVKVDKRMVRDHRTWLERLYTKPPKRPVARFDTKEQAEEYAKNLLTPLKPNQTVSEFSI